MIIDYLYTGVMSLVLAGAVDCVSGGLCQGYPIHANLHGRRVVNRELSQMALTY